MTQPSGPPQGTIGPTRLSGLVALFVLGAVLGYAIVSITEAWSGTAPRLQWTSVGALATISGVLLVLAFSTYRTVHRERKRMDPRRAMTFLMLAKASALMGALVAGGYAGFGAHFIDQLDVAFPRERAIRALGAAVAGVVIVISALLLERACRIPKDPDA